MGDVCDVNADFQVAVVQGAAVQGVIDVGTTRGIHRADVDVAEIDAFLQILESICFEKTLSER